MMQFFISVETRIPFRYNFFAVPKFGKNDSMTPLEECSHGKREARGLSPGRVAFSCPPLRHSLSKYRVKQGWYFIKNRCYIIATSFEKKLLRSCHCNDIRFCANCASCSLLKI